MKYIDSEKLKAEIERLRSNMDDRDPLAPNQKAGYLFALADVLSFLSTLESEKPINPDDAMKVLDEKIALVKRRGTWDGVDVDKYMDEIRGREPEKPIPADLEEAADGYRETKIANGHFFKIMDFSFLGFSLILNRKSKKGEFYGYPPRLGNGNREL